MKLTVEALEELEALAAIYGDDIQVLKVHHFVTAMQVKKYFLLIFMNH